MRGLTDCPDSGHGIHTPRSLRFVGQPSVPRHHELRSGDDEATSHRIMDAALDAGLTSSTPPTLVGWKKGEGNHRADSSAMRSLQGGDRARRWSSATKLYGSWRLAQRHSSPSQYPQCLRSVAPALQTDHIDLYQMHHATRHTRSTISGRRWRCWVQQGRSLRRILELRRLDDRAGPGDGPGAALPGLISEQCLYNLGRSAMSRRR